MANQATAKKGEEFKFKTRNTGTTKEKVLFERIAQQKDAATGKKQRADLTGETQRDVLTGKSNIVDFLEFKSRKDRGRVEKETVKEESVMVTEEDQPQSGQRGDQGDMVDLNSDGEIKRDKKKTEIDKLLEQISQAKTEELNGDEVFREKLDEKLADMVIGNDLETDKEQINQVKEIISENIEIEEVSAEVEAKKIVLEVKNIKMGHIEKIKAAERENLAKKFEIETKKKNRLDSEQEKSVKKIGETVAGVFYGDAVIKDSELMTENNQESTKGKIRNSQMEVQVIVGLLNKTPEEVKRIKNDYRSFKETNKIDLPFNEVPKLAAFDRVLNSLENQKIGQAFDLVHGGNWIQRIKGLGSNRIIESSAGFITTIGIQSSSDFVQNSIGMLVRSDFYGGFKNVLSGILSGGVRAVNGIGGITGSLGMAAKASNPVGWAVLGGKALLGKIAGGLKSLGIDLAGKIKNGAGSGGSKALGWLMGGIGAIGSISAIIAAMGPWVILVLLGSILGISVLTLGNTQSLSQIVPPVEISTETSSENTTTTPETVETNPGSDNTSNPSGAKYSVADKVVLTGQCRGDNRSVPMRADGKYPGRTICTSGCGPTATSEILQGQNKRYTPRYLMSNKRLIALNGESVANPYYNTYSGNGTTMNQARLTLVLVMGADKVTSVKPCSVTTMRELIRNGMAALVHMRYGNGGGHYAVAVAADNSGNVWIKDNGNSSVNIYPGGAYYKRSGGKRIDYCFGVKVKDSGVL